MDRPLLDKQRDCTIFNYYSKHSFQPYKTVVISVIREYICWYRYICNRPISADNINKPILVTPHIVLPFPYSNSPWKPKAAEAPRRELSASEPIHTEGLSGTLRAGQYKEKKFWRIIQNRLGIINRNNRQNILSKDVLMPGASSSESKKITLILRCRLFWSLWSRFHQALVCSPSDRECELCLNRH